MPLASSSYSYPLLDAFWTIFIIFLWVIWIWTLIWVFIDIFRSQDLSGWKKKFSPEEAVEIMQQVCRALEAAHGVGVIHRDLKPQNIMRDKSGRIIAMDFGLARTLEGDGMTQSGALVGTMEYMSPEQALGKALDQRSDIFALGLIFYEMLTGQTPFKAGQPAGEPDSADARASVAGF